MCWHLKLTSTELPGQLRASEEQIFGTETAEVQRYDLSAKSLETTAAFSALSAFFDLFLLLNW